MAGNFFTTLLAPPPGTELGAPVLIGPFVGLKKTFTAIGNLGGATIVVEASNKAVNPLVPIDSFGPVADLEFTGADGQSREVDGDFVWIRIKRLGGLGNTPIIIGLSGETACPCPVAPVTPIPPFLTLPMRTEDEAGVAFNSPFAVIAEETIDFTCLASIPNIVAKLCFVGRRDGAVGPPDSNTNFQVRIGGTPGNAADGVVVLASGGGDANFPNVAAPGGQQQASAPSIAFATPPPGGVLVKVCLQNTDTLLGPYDSFMRAITVLFGTSGLV